MGLGLRGRRRCARAGLVPDASVAGRRISIRRRAAPLALKDGLEAQEGIRGRLGWAIFGPVPQNIDVKKKKYYGAEIMKLRTIFLHSLLC